MKTIAETNLVFLQAMRAMYPGKGDAELCRSELKFAEVYCSSHPDFGTLRELFWKKMGENATISTYTGESMFELYPSCWIRMCDGTGNVNSYFCHIAGTETDARSIMGCKDFATFQQALGYILARHW